MTRRRWIIIGVAGTVVVVAGLGLLAAVVGRAIGPRPAATAIPPRTVSVVITTHDIPVRGLLQPEDLTLAEVPVQLAPREALSDPVSAVGRITTVPLATGETVFRHHLADPSNYTHDLAFVIDDDQVLMAFPASDLMSRLNVLQPGDVVDIFATLTSPALPEPGGTDEGESALFTFDAMQQVEISAVVIEVLRTQRPQTASGTAVQVGESEVQIQAQPTPTPQPAQPPQGLLLALDPQDALVLKYIKDAGGVIDIVLRAPTATVQFELSPVMAEYLRDRFELVISR